MSSGASPPPPPSLPSGVEYKVVSWNSQNYEGYRQDGYGGYSPVEAYKSSSSFVDVARREGLTDEDIFTTCSYPKSNFSLTGGPPVPYYGLPLYAVETYIRDCVIGKLVNTIAQDRWLLLLTATETPKSLNLAVYHFMATDKLYFQRNA
jgi:hypothetical protein